MRGRSMDVKSALELLSIVWFGLQTYIELQRLWQTYNWNGCRRLVALPLT